MNIILINNQIKLNQTKNIKLQRIETIYQINFLVLIVSLKVIFIQQQNNINNISLRQQKMSIKKQIVQKVGPSKAYELLMTDHEFYVIISYKHANFQIRTTTKQFQQFSSIKINRLTSKIIKLQEEQFNSQITHINTKYRQLIDLILGIIIINTQPYLLVVTQIQSPATLQKDKIYQVRQTKFIPFKHKFLYNSIDQSENQKLLSYLRDQFLANNFYFCYHQDLTLTRTKFYDKVSTEKKYWWNQSMLGLFHKNQLKECWNIKVIQGYVKQIYCQNQYFSFYYAMISRRSKEMSGTRFNHRGLNQNFDTSNFVQTQQILICHNYLFSHVSLRGSVPLFWKQQNVKSDIILKHKLEQQHEKGITMHYNSLQSQYKGKICTINLLSKTKMPEKDLKSRFEYYFFRSFKQSQTNNIYMYFDLNEEMKEDNGQKSIDMFMQASQKMFSDQQNFFVIDRYTQKVLGVQKIYPRINCLDCIDRTNVIMARISEHYLHQVQEYINSRVKIKQKYLQLGKSFIKNLIELWVELGNRISMLYCGTESVANHMTKKQNNSLLTFLSGGIKSINRYYNANVNDNYKHQSIQYFLGKKGAASETHYFQDNIEGKILDQLKYCSYEEMKMYIVTWNCNMVDPFKLTPKQKQKIFTFLNQDIDAVIFNLQEIVELNSYNVLLGNNQNILGDWSKVILQCLNNPLINKNLKNNPEKTFLLSTNHDLVGVATFVFCTKKIANKIEHYEWLDIKTGFKGNSGHKGAIMLFLLIDSSWITMINCHLASGQGKKSERFQDIQFMHNQAIKQRRKRRLFDISEFKFFSGDMNFCLDLKNDFVSQRLNLIQKKDRQKKLTKQQLQQLLKPLLEKDQRNLNKIGYLYSYQEGQINFMPTYCIDVKFKAYDTKRTPYWYDRILFQSKQKNKISLLRYNDIDVYLSDHKPVYAMLNILIKKENLERKNKFLEAYLMG